MTRYGMVIDLHKCAGCGACGIGCKKENNVDTGMFWSHHLIRESGTFPNIRHEYIPTMCNHCSNAECVRVCPTSAMRKDENGLTKHDASRCIGCKSCMMACPYNVINFNRKDVERSWDNDEAAIVGCTSTAKELQSKTGFPTPYYNKDREATYPGVREVGTVEKCTMCDHRIKNGLPPYCAEICPAQARIFGDLDDPSSEASRLLAQYGSSVLKPEAGTKPAVHYVRNF
ncbi:MAG: 4Fe-4S dicluster domain-containing protein [Gordonibacter sp.]|nr:4Fe-4S dicluster domain-containing protein [Gordonibacter sp.]